MLGDNTVVRTGSQIGGSIVGQNVYVASGAVVTGAVLMDAVEVHENASIAQGAVVGDRSIIGRNAVVANNVKIYPLKNIEPGSTVRSSIVWETRGASSLFGRNGVRGLANVDVTPEMAMRLAMSYGTLIGKGSYVTTSRDTHHACRVFKRAIISGLNSTGVNVRDLTTAPLAVNRFDLKSANATGGIHVQMSLDNPEAIEILFSEAPGVPIDGKRERAIENHYFREDFRRAAFEEMGQVVYPPRVMETYTNSLLENWNTVAIRGRQPRLVLDYSLSAPAFFFPTTLDKLGVETIALNTFSRSRSRFTIEESLPAAAARVGEMVQGHGRRPRRRPRSGRRVPLPGRREGPPRPRVRADAPSAAARRPRSGDRGGRPAAPRHRLAEQVVGVDRGEHPPHPVLQGVGHGRVHPTEHGLCGYDRRGLHLPGGAALTRCALRLGQGAGVGLHVRRAAVATDRARCRWRTWSTCRSTARGSSRARSCAA